MSCGYNHYLSFTVKKSFILKELCVLLTEIKECVLVKNTEKLQTVNQISIMLLQVISF